MYRKRRGIRPRTPVGLWRLGASSPDPALLLSPTCGAFVEYVTAIESALLLRKITEVTTVNVLVLFFPHFRAYFHFKLYSFCWCGLKNILCFREPGTLATSLVRLLGLHVKLRAYQRKMLCLMLPFY